MFKAGFDQFKRVDPYLSFGSYLYSGAALIGLPVAAMMGWLSAQLSWFWATFQWFGVGVVALVSWVLAGIALNIHRHRGRAIHPLLIIAAIAGLVMVGSLIAYSYVQGKPDDVASGHIEPSKDDASQNSAPVFDLGPGAEAVIKSVEVEGDFKIVKAAGAAKIYMEGTSFKKIPPTFPTPPVELVSLSNQALRAEAANIAVKLRGWAKSGIRPDLPIRPALVASAIIAKTGTIELPAVPLHPSNDSGMDAVEKFHVEDSRVRHLRWGSMFILVEFNATAAPNVADFLDYIAGKLGP